MGPPRTADGLAGDQGHDARQHAIGRHEQPAFAQHFDEAGRTRRTSRTLRRYPLPFDIDERNSWLVLVFAIFDSSSSMASTGESGVRTFLRTHTRLRSSFGSSSS